ncbi:cyclic nucleotide-binding domain protein [Aspergillus clavatus NRRL 1]|uniref:Cyclic nucleotide-binding domain protein n=1 Tax=Aspergillus clavatus (strain ATCC 1007 / CBS 513.65 / DSM 816 / NCTC 3887 / NRRL 1 / QM 1276 / 107) TaxID=344612 RepID=A1CEZ1_ASPCL|nr:cyclic nucleotide-binding domain protein [Aspergillus clavatus NRRL 1]EAW11440.1 cyclic nucleotide-binding domain protein [Aspergillus clavatus NRRL 1]
MRRHGRSGGGTKAVTPVSDTVSLIHSFDSITNPNRPARPSPLASSHIQALPLDLIDRLRSFPLFQSTPESFLVEVAQHLRPQLSAPNDYILTEGDEAKAIYWLVRGAVSVTSRDGESIYAELEPGAFFGEIGVLMDRPRTATIIARTRCLLVVLSKEDFRNILPRFPEVERAIRDEAQERLMILEKKKKETSTPSVDIATPVRRGSKRLRDSYSGDLAPVDRQGTNLKTGNKKRKSPSPGLGAAESSSSALANGSVNVRLLLKELPLFSSLPPDILHFLGLNAQPRSYPPFTDIIRQDSQGREIYFIVRGEVEVLSERTDIQDKQSLPNGIDTPAFDVKARLKQGQYFGEVVSLSLAPRRTATVRSVTAVECLMLSGDVLAEFWDKLPQDVRQQVENTAKERLQAASDGDVVMSDAGSADQPVDGDFQIRASRRQSMPLLTLTETELDTPRAPNGMEDQNVLKPSDPDPFLNVGLDNVRLRSRRGSVAPLTPEEVSGDQQRQSPPQASRSARSSLMSLSETSVLSTASKTQRESRQDNLGILPDNILIKVFQYLNLHDLLRFRAVSLHWSEILSTSSELVRHLDLSMYNRHLTDDVLVKVICPFVGERPHYVNISNCFHITDEGFSKLATTCGANVTAWKMKSVWDVTASAVLEMASKATGLEEVDLSNCRKVGDTLLARLIGWVVPGQHKPNGEPAKSGKAVVKPTMQTEAGTVYGCPKLKRLTLSYCKHVTDRSMHHIASHAASRIEQMDLTRCTTITDQGFQYWGNAQFTNLRKLCLADCTYLTDNAIIYLTNAAKQLQELDLSFCCALSDTATEVLALQCSQLTYLNMSFCGSAISDPSLRSIGLHLLHLKRLSVRGCVRVTGVGVEAVADGCNQLDSFDVSQCKNLAPWLEDGGALKYKNRITFETVAQNGIVFR